MQVRYVFMLGRPGCGKSALYGELEGRLLETGQAKTFERVDDFPILREWFLADDALNAQGKERIHSERTFFGGYQPQDHVFNDILKQVSANLLKIDRPDHLVFVEFARSNYVEAIQNFDPSILEQSLVIYMEVSFETCWQRNLARQAGDLFDGGDDHGLPRETMESLFKEDDRDAFIGYLQARGIPALVVNNEADGEEHLKRRVEALLETLFQKNGTAGPEPDG